MEITKNMYYAVIISIYAACLYLGQKNMYFCGGVSSLAVAAILFVVPATATESFHDFDDQGAPYNDPESMGEYDNTMLVKPGQPYLKQNNKSLLNPDQTYTLQGTPTGLEDSLTSQDPTTNYATVDGTDGTPKSMFVFAYNQSSPECCPSTYTTSSGCVCTTDQQREFISGRGGNNEAPSLF
jgi:hypothetical protein